MDLHVTVMVVAGVAVLLMAILPRLSPRFAFSTPLVVLAFGFAVFALPSGLPDIDPIANAGVVEYLTEFAVIVALTGAGLKLDRRVGWRRWRSTWILLAVTMPLTIAMTFLLGWLAIGLAPAAALLIAAAIAPTDPVLAADVQVGPPGQDPEEEGRVGFALTSEAGLNDGLAFPFTNAAIAMAVASSSSGGWVVDWLLVDVLWKLGAGVAGGVVVGYVFGRLLFGNLQLSRYTDGLVALASTLLSYGLVEAIGGYGFLAVFIAAYMIRDSERDHEDHRSMHRLIEQVEHLALVAVLILVAGAVSDGILAALTPAAIAAAFVIVLVVRPLAGLPVLASREFDSRAQALTVASFGIRGIGSIYYLAYALNHAEFEQERLLWATVVLVVLISVVLHGVTSTRVMRRVEPEAVRVDDQSDEPGASA